MPTTLDLAMPHPGAVEELMAEPDLSNLPKAPHDASVHGRAPSAPGCRRWLPAADQDHGSDVPVANGVRRRLTNLLRAGDSRWLLYLQDADGQENWHLFRVDVAAPQEPAMNLTPLPQNSRVVTVDPLVTSPGLVLVGMNEGSEHVDHVLIDVRTGETTALLPSGRRG